MKQPLPGSPLSPLALFVLTVLFWGMLISAVGIHAGLVLAPRLVEHERLRRQYLKNAATIEQLNGESNHLEKVAAALQTDPDFAARVARRELQAIVKGTEHIALDQGLGYDARVPAAVPATPDVAPPPWYLPWVEALATPSPWRSRLAAASVLMVLTAFFCLNEAFFRSGVGRFLLSVLGTLGRRYVRIPPSGA